MLKKFMRSRFRLIRSQKGMTLIELLAVVVILGILAAVAGAVVIKGFNSAKENADKTSVTVIKDAAQRYIMDKNPAETAVTVTNLVSEGYMNQAPTSSVDSTKTKFIITAAKNASNVWTIDVATDATGN